MDLLIKDNLMPPRRMDVLGLAAPSIGHEPQVRPAICRGWGPNRAAAASGSGRPPAWLPLAGEGRDGALAVAEPEIERR